MPHFVQHLHRIKCLIIGLITTNGFVYGSHFCGGLLGRCCEVHPKEFVDPLQFYAAQPQAQQAAGPQAAPQQPLQVACANVLIVEVWGPKNSPHKNCCHTLDRLWLSEVIKKIFLHVAHSIMNKIRNYQLSSHSNYVCINQYIV